MDKIYLNNQEMCVIQLQNDWNRFCREIILLSAYASPYTATGLRLPRSATYNSRQDTITKLLKLLKKSYEPDWYKPKSAIEAANKLSVPNRANISAALGATPSPTDDIRHIRNFFAHRNEETALKARAVIIASGYPSNTSPLDYCVSTPNKPTISQFEEWINALRLMALAAIQ